MVHCDCMRLEFAKLDHGGNSGFVVHSMRRSSLSVVLLSTSAFGRIQFLQKAGWWCKRLSHCIPASYYGVRFSGPISLRRYASEPSRASSWIMGMTDSANRQVQSACAVYLEVSISVQVRESIIGRYPDELVSLGVSDY